MDAGSPASSSTERASVDPVARLTDTPGTPPTPPTRRRRTAADPARRTPCRRCRAGDRAEGADLARRRFFRQFAGEMFQGAATVVGAAQALQRVSAEAASAILDPGSVTTRPRRSGGRRARADRVSGRLPREPGRPPHRRPAQAARCARGVRRRRTPPQVGYAIREMIIRGAPAIGQVAAIGLALSAEAKPVDRVRTRAARRCVAPPTSCATPDRPRSTWAGPSTV